MIGASIGADHALAGPAGPTERLPTLGFHTYPSLPACEAAVAENTPRPDTRLVCLPIEPPPGMPFSAH